jgi:hypothetical protein
LKSAVASRIDERRRRRQLFFINIISGIGIGFARRASTVYNTPPVELAKADACFFLTLTDRRKTS